VRLVSTWRASLLVDFSENFANFFRKFSGNFAEFSEFLRDFSDPRVARGSQNHPFCRENSAENCAEKHFREEFFREFSLRALRFLASRLAPEAAPPARLGAAEAEPGVLVWAPLASHGELDGAELGSVSASALLAIRGHRRWRCRSGCISQCR